jgi:hypothetical protein
MKYFLVLQWPASAITDYNEIIEFKEKLEADLTNDASVNGLDKGSGEINIFIDTDDPMQSFEDVRASVDTQPLGDEMRVAYREATGDTYTVIWPKYLSSFAVA